MSTIVIGVDRNNSPSNDIAFQNAVAKALEKAGHNVEKLEREPNAFASYSYSNKAKGKIGIYLIAAGTYSIADFYYGAASGGGSFKYAYFGIRGDLSVRPHSQSEFESAHIGADADCPASLCAHIKGMTFPQMNEKLKDKCHIVFGKTGEAMANEIIKAMGGDTTDSSSKSKSSSGSTIKEALKKAVSPWDGEVEIRLVGDTVYVNKIPDPTKTKLVVNEFDNVIYDSITVTDIIPTTVNILKLTYKDYELTLKDSDLIKRFGKITKTIKAPATVKSLDDAKAYLNLEWNKIRRNDGRQVELKVHGSSKWKGGKWVQVYLPSFHIDDYMYIVKTSHEEDSTNNWLTGLSLVDYPPSFGVEEKSSKKSKKSKKKSKKSESSDSTGDSS